jgi:hypothetical protein
MAGMKLTLTEVLKASKHFQGMRSWDISDNVILYCSAEEAWYDGPLYCEGWSVVIVIDPFARNHLGWVLLAITKEEARDFLWTKYAK